ncbi:3-keto-disaccharide hydrolase [Kordiimonas sp.]|uniref:3-keto-disaccharide hydrolase n=1 Tax=Kordiimonas sp. TaxID=1970157 RepID=UPI003A94AE44
MKKSLFGIVMALALNTAILADTPNTLSEHEKAAGWQLLFDGKTTDGWRSYGKPELSAEWHVEDGTLTFTPGKAGDIITEGTFTSFELSIDWKISVGGNSGIFFHVVEGPSYAYMTGPEYQLLDNAGRDEPPLEQAAALFALYAPSRDVSHAADSWNTSKLVVIGEQVEHWLNGVKVVEYDMSSDNFKARVAASKFSPTGRNAAVMKDFAKARSGHIALQDHGDKIAFRNIKIKPLP